MKMEVLFDGDDLLLEGKTTFTSDDNTFHRPEVFPKKKKGKYEAHSSSQHIQ